jgi:predicted DsbA family dithiol-disulfide isomerase
MAKAIKIDFVSDVSCPWCAIGLKSLETAIEGLKGEIEADIRFQPFELLPGTAPAGVNIYETMAGRTGQTKDQVAAQLNAIAQRAADVGFTMKFNEKTRAYDTFDAHRLLYWAGELGRQQELKNALFSAHFTEGLAIGDHQVLTDKAEAAGLPAEEAALVLSSGRYAEEVRREEALWRQRGVTSVPSIILNDRYIISGGQPPAAFEQALRNVAAKSQVAA